MTKLVSLHEFLKMYPDDDACLDHLFKQRFGHVTVCSKCNKPTKFHRLANERAYSCQVCGHHIHPMVGTPFHRSHTPLTKWFYAMYLFTTTRHGVSGKELERQLGVSYETAWRMGHKIRQYMASLDGQGPLDGDVEADETYIGGKRKGGKRGRGAPGKTVVFGMQDRDGEIITQIVPNVRAKTLRVIIKRHVLKGSTLHTDELPSYRGIDGFQHETVNHSAGEYARDGSHVNTVESFWSVLKKSIRSTHVWVSRKYLTNYLREFEFRHNLRHAPHLMLRRMMAFQRP